MNCAFHSPDEFRLSVAPMMDWTDRHCRYFHRQLSTSAWLYTEMVTTGAIIHGHRERFLGFHPGEHPLALQLGGSDPKELAECAVIAQEWGYDEVNLNVGCPSDRVQRGRFGACLMLEPDLVRDCISAMIDAVSIPITVKTRLGVDDHDSYDYFRAFIDKVSDSGCRHFIVHARKAWLSGLSPKQNRDIPDLRYEWVYQLKQERPDLTVMLNGGITSVDAVEAQIGRVDGVMLGRAAYQSPWLLAELQQHLYGLNGASQGECLTREQVVARMTTYLEDQYQHGVPVKAISRHLLGLFQGLPGARKWRRYISEHAHLDDANTQLLQLAFAELQSVLAESDSAAIQPATVE